MTKLKKVPRELLIDCVLIYGDFFGMDELKIRKTKKSMPTLIKDVFLMRTSSYSTLMKTVG